MARHGRYTIVRKLANGGMAEIFLAKQQGHEGFEKPVVLKRILSSIYADPQFRNMLIDEAHISMGLTHSNIVQVLDLGLSGGRYFLVLELVDGWDLGQILQRAKTSSLALPQELGVFIVTEVCRALAYAHAKAGPDGAPLGIVHRDVSPNNVLISEHGEVKLADFGIAKAIHKREHTGTGVVKGKVAFMSPEQGLGRPIDARSDVFSLGSLLYLLAVGARPFEASTDLESLLRVQRGEFVAPATAKPDIEPEVARIIEHAMRFSPDQRYQNAYDMLLDLERVLRTLYGAVGQTELRQYLAELGRVDGVPPIGRAQPVVDGIPTTGELVEGNAVELGDAVDDIGIEKTGLAEIPPEPTERGEFPRFPRRTMEIGRFPTPAPGTARELTPARATRRPIEELALGEQLGDAPPVRYGQHKSRWPTTLLVLILIGGAGFGAARYFGWIDRVRAMIARSQEAQEKNDTNDSPSAATKAPSPAPAAPPHAAAPVRTSKRNVPPKAEEPRVEKPPEAAEPPPSAAEAPAAEGAFAAAPNAAPPSADQTTEERRRPAAARGDAPPGKVAGPKGRGEASSSNNVFKESAKRVRSISQGLEYVPPGTIELRNPTSDPAPSPPPPAPPAADPTPPAESN